MDSSPRNKCSACGVDFDTLQLFDDHRKLWKIVRDHSTKVCWELIESGKHSRGECQHLVGRCKTPQEMGLVRCRSFWATAEGKERFELRSARRAKS